ncbi:MAG TPA: ABC transporter permease [Clostridia bacterium]|nr:ABC transporter permease [Clostridia bacterium]
MKAAVLKEGARYFLSASGIIIGIFILTAVLGIAEGGRAVLNESFRQSGLRLYDIEISDKGAASEDYLLPEDGRLLERKMPEVKGTIPVLELQAQLKSYKASGSSRILAVNEKYLRYANLEMLGGSFISSVDVRKANKVVIIDDLTALELFGTKDIIEQKLDLVVGGRKVEFAVAGVFRNFNRNIETLFEEEVPGMCLIPDSVPEEVSFDFGMEKLIALVDNGVHKEEAAIRLAHVLEKEHGVTEAYSITEYVQLSQVSAFTDKYLVFAVITAIVGLISGGIGVMNRMLLSIQERKVEIGLYKFYGSGIKELQYDIVYRTMVICHGFGMLGLLLGIPAGNFIGSYINIRTGFSLLTIFVTITATALVGILSSLPPALKIKQVDAVGVIRGE